MSKYSAR